jgi:hypothetical protein
LEVTLITPRAPETIMAGVKASSPDSTVRASPKRFTTCWQRRTLPVASLTATTFGVASTMRASVSVVRSTTERAGML